MDMAAAEKILIDASNEQTSYAVGKLSALTPGVNYTPQPLYDRLEERLSEHGADKERVRKLILFIAAFSDSAMKLENEGFAGSIHLGGHSSKGVLTGDWEMAFERTAVELVPEQTTLDAIGVLSAQEPEVLRKTISRLIDTTEMTFVMPVGEFQNFTLEDSAKIGAGFLKDILSVDQTVKLVGFVMRPGDGVGDIVQIMVSRMDPKPEEESPSPSVH